MAKYAGGSPSSEPQTGKFSHLRFSLSGTASRFRKRCQDASSSTGALLFSSCEFIRAAYPARIPSGSGHDRTVGTMRIWPVSLTPRRRLRARMAQMAASYAPLVPPLTMKPFETSPPKSAACAAVHFSAFSALEKMLRQPFSGASRYEKEVSRMALCDYGAAA